MSNNASPGKAKGLGELTEAMTPAGRSQSICQVLWRKPSHCPRALPDASVTLERIAGYSDCHRPIVPPGTGRGRLLSTPSIIIIDPNEFISLFIDI